MEEITFKRILRWTLASLIVVVLIAYGFGVGIASAESGTIIISDDKTYDYTKTAVSCTVSCGIVFNSLRFDNTNYNYIADVNILISGATFSYGFESSYFTISSGGSGDGYIWYDKNFSKIYYSFSTTSTFNSNVITISPVKNIFANVTFSGVTDHDPSSTQPVMIRTESGTDGMIGAYHTTVAVRATDSYLVEYFNNLFSVSITKNSFVNTKYFIKGRNTIYSQEMTFNKVNIDNATFVYNDGIYLNATLSSGIYTIVLINSTGSGLPPPDPTPIIDPVTGAGIVFNKETYSIGETVKVSWARTPGSTPLLYQDAIFYGYTVADSDVEGVDCDHKGSDWCSYYIQQNPPDSGNYSFTAQRAGRLWTTFTRCFLNCEISNVKDISYGTRLAIDWATIVSDDPSYVIVNSTVAVGKVISVGYSLGFSNTYFNPQLLIYRNKDGEFVKEDAIILPMNYTRNTLYYANVVFRNTGDYLVKVCNMDTDYCSSSVKTTSKSIDIPVYFNITNSVLTMDASTYYFDETAHIEVVVDDVNFSRSVSLDVINNDNQIVTFVNSVLGNKWDYSIQISPEKYYSGNNTLRLWSRNDSYGAIVKYVNFTITQTDSEGNGLKTDKESYCMDDKGIITVTTISGNLSLTITDPNLKTETYLINKTVKINKIFDKSGTYYIRLWSGNNIIRMIPIIVKSDCVDIPPSGWAPGSGGTAATCEFWDGWVANLAGGQGVNDLTRFMFALVVIGMITAFTTIITKNLGAGVIVGFFPYAFFVFISLSTPCGQYMPVWTAVFIALIVGVKMRWFS